MQSSYWSVRAVAGLMLMTLIGCQSYAPYGPGAYPGVYQGAAIGAMAPQAASLQPSTLPQTSSQSYVAPAPNQAGAWRQSQDSAAVQGSFGSAPAFDSNAGGATSPTSVDPVPEPGDLVAPPAGGLGFDDVGFES